MIDHNMFVDQPKTDLTQNNQQNLDYPKSPIGPYYMNSPKKTSANMNLNVIYKDI